MFPHPWMHPFNICFARAAKQTCCDSLLLEHARRCKMFMTSQSYIHVVLCNQTQPTIKEGSGYPAVPGFIIHQESVINISDVKIKNMQVCSDDNQNVQICDPITNVCSDAI